MANEAEKLQDSASSRMAVAPKPSRMRAILKWLRRLALVSLALMGLSMIAIALLIRHYEAGLPPTDELKRYTPKQVTRILARDGTLLAEDFTERRTVVHISDIPPHVQLAFLAAEDASFYEHQGLDYPGMLRALWVNLRSNRKQGASTITQQVVKNVLLTSERTFRRKVEEIILARKIEQELTKDEILELYLNYIYFGHGRYGVEEASKYYFGKSVRDLTLAEAAILAGIPKGPSIYEPRAHLDKALGRQKYVLGQMLDKGFAKPEAVEEAKNEKIVVAPEPEAMSELAPEAVVEARKELRAIVGEAAANEGGYTVTTTIDPKLEETARKAVRDNLKAYDARWQLVAPFKKPAPPVVKKGMKPPPPPPAPKFFEGDPTGETHVVVGEVKGADDTRDVVEVRVGTGVGTLRMDLLDRYNAAKLPASKFIEVGMPIRVTIAALGEPDPDGAHRHMLLRPQIGPEGALVAIDVATREILALVGSYDANRSGLDRATHAHRQPGSTFKTFTYSYAIHAGAVTPATLLPTMPGALGGKGPKNYDASENGAPLRLRVALAQSVNVSAQWTAEKVGPANVASWAKAAGIESPLGATPSIALGAYEVTPLELANGYTTFAAGGLYQEARLISKIVGPDGREVPLPAITPPARVMSDVEAFMTIDLLKSVISSGTGTAAKVLNRPLAGKTGTSNDAKDAWFAGFTPDLTCVVWTGYDDAIPLGAHEAGAKTSLPAFIDFMKVATAGRVATDFPIAAGIVRVDIDPVSGLLARPDQTDAISEVFVAGTEPKEVAKAPEPTPDPADPPESPRVADGDHPLLVVNPNR
ncbi:MAG: PBP1A family penicillin-binding protein [Polyangiaceae bacterium]